MRLVPTDVRHAFRVLSRNPGFTFAGAAGLLLLVAFLAADVPSRRASRTDPLVAIRAE